MKKTLLTLALAALATTAFAGNVYKYDSATSLATLNLDTTLSYDSYVAKDAQYNFSDKTKISNNHGKIIYTKTTGKETHFKPSFKFAVAAKGLDKNTGFFISTFGEVKSKVDFKIHPKSKEFTNLYLNKAYVAFGSDAYGTFKLGKMNTVSDEKFGTISNIDKFTTSAHSDETKFDFVATYLSPSYSGLKIGASYGETKFAKKEFERQLAGLVTYTNFGTDFTLVGYKNTNKKDTFKQFSQVGFDLAASHKFGYNEVTVTGGYKTAHNSVAVLDGYVDLADTSYKGFQKQTAWNVAFEASNDFYTFAQPYFGLYYVSEIDLPRDRASKTKVKTATTLLGLNSDLFEVASLKASTYVEAAYNLQASYTKNYNTNALENKTIVKGYKLGFGLKVTF